LLLKDDAIQSQLKCQIANGKTQWRSDKQVSLVPPVLSVVRSSMRCAIQEQIRFRSCRVRNRILRRSLALVVGSGVLALMTFITLRMMLPVFHFPTPSGPYAIGTLTYHWIDADRPDVFSSDPNARRELMVQIWYPAKAAKSLASPHTLYVHDADALAMALSKLKNMPAALFGQLKYVTSHATLGAPVAEAKSNYPVLIFLEGAIGFRQMNTFQVEALVAQGFVVVAIDQPHTAAVVVFPDGREVGALPLDQMLPLIHQSHSPAHIAPVFNGRTFDTGIVPYLAADVSFTLNRLATLNHADPNAILTGRLDMLSVGAFGISLGGIVGGEACRIEPRLRACLFMDAPCQSTLSNQVWRNPPFGSPAMQKPCDWNDNVQAAGQSWTSANIRPACAQHSPTRTALVTSCKCRACSMSI
jgi:hypothetical protein